MEKAYKRLNWKNIQKLTQKKHNNNTKSRRVKRNAYTQSYQSNNNYKRTGITSSFFYSTRTGITLWW